MKHNGYCWKRFYSQCKSDGINDRLRGEYVKIRVHELMDCGMNYGYSIWFATWECVKRYGSPRY